jgi:hypothetical protein
MSYFPGMFLRYFLNEFEMLLVDPDITGITFVFAFHMHCISIAKLSSLSPSAHRQFTALARSWANYIEVSKLFFFANKCTLY